MFGLKMEVWVVWKADGPVKIIKEDDERKVRLWLLQQPDKESLILTKIEVSSLA